MPEPTIAVSLYHKQGLFVQSNAKFPCFAGGFGNGKSFAGCLRALHWMLSYPGCTGLIGRLTYTELWNTTQKDFLKLCETILPSIYGKKSQGWTYLQNRGYLQFPNKSEVYFLHLDTVSEMEIRSMNLTFFYIDQAEEIGESVFLALVGRLRNPIGTPSGWITCNPAPGWIHRRYKARPDPDTELIEAASYENPWLVKGYVDSLRQRYPAAWIQRYVEGSWTAFEGQVFPEFGDAQIKAPPPQDEWPVDVDMLCGIDHGLRNPTAAVWAMIDWYGRIWIVSEYEESGRIVSENVKAILAISHTFRHPVDPTKVRTIEYVIDPSSQAREPIEGKQIIDEYYESFGYGTFLAPGNNDVMAGLGRLAELFHGGGLYIAPSCRRLVDALSSYHWQDHSVSGGENPREAPEKTNDHLIDALRYLVMQRPEPPERHDVDPIGRTFKKVMDRERARRMSQSLIGYTRMP